MHTNPVIQQIYDQIGQRQERQQQINYLTSRLIKEQQIQAGDTLYLFLGLGKRCNNIQAIQQWIAETIDHITDREDSDDQETYQYLEHQFLQLMPEMG